MLRICYRLCIGLVLLATAAGAAPRLASDYRDYRIQLAAWRPAGPTPAGMLVPVRINQGPVLQLVLDSGATGITLSSRAARHLHLETLAEASVAGLGGKQETQVRTALASTVTIGDLLLEACPLQVVSQDLTREADGIIGTKVFEAFRIHLDAPARELRLEAYGHEAGTPNTSDLLFVRARVNGATEGLFLVDTGSAVTSLSSDLRWPAAPSGTTAQLTGAGGDLPEARYLAPVSLEINGRKVVERAPVSLNLEAVSRRNGVRVAGILGYSVLSRTRVTFDYREGRVELSAR